MEVLISIIIPVYNVEEYIHKCMKSVLSQDLGEAEVLLVDDGSPDGCGKICDEYARKHPSKVRVIHQLNRGLSGARNTGIRESNGRYLFFIDSDDYLAKDAVASIVGELKAHGYPDMLIFDSRLVDEYDNVISARINGSGVHGRCAAGQPMKLEDNKELLFEFPSAWTRVTKKELFVDNDIFFPLGLWFEDIASTPLLLAKCKSIVYFDKILYNYLQREGSITSNGNAKRRCDDAIADFEITLGWFAENELFVKYRSQLEYMAIAELLIIQAVMITIIGGAREYVDKLVDFVLIRFPHFMENTYLRQGEKKQYWKVKLLADRRYPLLKAALFLQRMRKRISR